MIKLNMVLDRMVKEEDLNKKSKILLNSVERPTTKEIKWQKCT